MQIFNFLIISLNFVKNEPEPRKRNKFREFTRPRISQEPVDKIANRDETSKSSTIYSVVHFF